MLKFCREHIDQTFSLFCHTLDIEVFRSNYSNLYNKKVLEYFSNGFLKKETLYYNGKKHGIEKWYDLKGKIRIESPFNNNNKIHGIEKRYYATGELEEEISYFNGKRHGISNKYYVTGELKEKISYFNDKRHGISKIYYKFGGVYRKRFFISDEETVFPYDKFR